MLRRPGVTLLLLLAAACAPGTPPADLVVFGKVWTGDSAHPLAAAGKGEAQRGGVRAQRIFGLADVVVEIVGRQ